MSLGSMGDEAGKFLSNKRIHDEWEAEYLNHDLDKFYDEAFERIAELLDAPAEAMLLDAGCGYGFHAVRLARHGFDVVGVDFSAAALAEAQKRVSCENLSHRILLQRADLLRLPHLDNSFDAINCWGVLMHIPEVERALDELMRVLRPGGRLAICENNEFSVHAQTWERITPVLRRLLKMPTRQVEKNVRGKEEWIEKETGGLMVRKTNMKWLIRYIDSIGGSLICREAGQLTEIYSLLSWKPAKKVIYHMNMWWMKKIKHPGPALGNILVFEKRKTKITGASNIALRSL